MGDGIASMASGAGELIGDLKTTVGNINKIVTKLDSTVLAKSELDSITATIRNLETTTGKLAASSSKIESLVTQAESTIKNGNETMTSAKKAADELQHTLASFRQLAEQARKGSGVLGSLISNREMADNLRVFILNLRKHGILWYKDTQKVKSGDAE
jgi:ABC-type transporter Mla subunit MlaD